jgi:predicted amidohydrolase
VSGSARFFNACVLVGPHGVIGVYRKVHLPFLGVENTVYVMAVNRVGVESGFRFIGASSIADPSKNVLARAGAEAEQTLLADIDPLRARTKHLVRVLGRHEINRIADRRTGFYGPLVEPNGRS